MAKKSIIKPPLFIAASRTVFFLNRYLLHLVVYCNKRRFTIMNDPTTKEVRVDYKDSKTSFKTLEDALEGISTITSRAERLQYLKESQKESEE